jgi:hypothetical protein
MMLMLDRLDRNVTLMNRMADRVEADFAEALLNGALTGGDMRDAVLRCSRCGAAEECAQWLDMQDGTPAVHPAAPGFCANADLMDRLRP